MFLMSDPKTELQGFRELDRAAMEYPDHEKFRDAAAMRGTIRIKRVDEAIAKAQRLAKQHRLKEASNTLEQASSVYADADGLERINNALEAIGRQEVISHQ